MTTPGDQQFAGKVAFVTGGAIGFGRAFAEALAAEGATSIIADINIDAAERAAKELREQGHEALAVECDVADASAVSSAVAQSVGEYGGIDILINNAGLHLTRYNRPYAEMPEADLRAVMDVNVFGTINCSLACVESMATRGGGVIVNISSMASYMAGTAYAVSKLAVRGLTTGFASEFAPHNVRVNCIAPGLIASESAVDDLPQETVDHFVDGEQRIHRLGRVGDIVDTMLFLCGEQSSFMTGETLRVTGGVQLGI